MVLPLAPLGRNRPYGLSLRLSVYSSVFRRRACVCLQVCASKDALVCHTSERNIAPHPFPALSLTIYTHTHSETIRPGRHSARLGSAGCFRLFLFATARLEDQKKKGILGGAEEGKWRRWRKRAKR